MAFSNDIAFLLPFGVTLGAIALAGSLALVMMAMRMRSDALLKRAARLLRRTTQPWAVRSISRSLGSLPTASP